MCPLFAFTKFIISLNLNDRFAFDENVFLNEFFITCTAIIRSPTVSEKLNFTVQ